jgi:hypothetical protein
VQITDSLQPWRLQAVCFATACAVSCAPDPSALPHTAIPAPHLHTVPDVAGTVVHLQVAQLAPHAHWPTWHCCRSVRPLQRQGSKMKTHSQAAAALRKKPASQRMVVCVLIDYQICLITCTQCVGSSVWHTGCFVHAQPTICCCSARRLRTMGWQATNVTNKHLQSTPPHCMGPSATSNTRQAAAAAAAAAAQHSAAHQSAGACSPRVTMAVGIVSLTIFFVEAVSRPDTAEGKRQMPNLGAASA